jgi:hypothetical protein
MNALLEERYFNWLYSKVVLDGVTSTTKKYYQLLKLLHKMEFIWLVTGDDNRAEYGQELRKFFLEEKNLRASDHFAWLRETCSVLEMLIALANEAELDTDIPREQWFWTFLENLGLKDMSDDSGTDWADAQHIVEEFLWRTYQYNGEGGLFPLHHPDRDQRGVEIWYQFSAYVIERQLV